MTISYPNNMTHDNIGKKNRATLLVSLVYDGLTNEANNVARFFLSMVHLRIFYYSVHIKSSVVNAYK